MRTLPHHRRGNQGDAGFGYDTGTTIRKGMLPELNSMLPNVISLQATFVFFFFLVSEATSFDKFVWFIGFFLFLNEEFRENVVHSWIRRRFSFELGH